MADKDWWKGQHATGAALFNGVTPAFDDFTPSAKITDMYFRTDLPLLMLYLDKHTPDPKTIPFKNYLTDDGTSDLILL